MSAVVLAMTTEKLPAPFVPQDCQLSGPEWMPLFGDSLFTSTFFAEASAVEYRAATRLWWAAWKAKPAGSLPNNEKTLADLAGFGSDLRGWRRIRENALWGFTLCSDGRLYHQMLSREAMRFWQKRVRERDKKRAQRGGGGDASPPDTGNFDGSLPPDAGKFAETSPLDAGNNPAELQAHIEQNQGIDVACPQDVPLQKKREEGIGEQNSVVPSGTTASADAAAQGVSFGFGLPEAFDAKRQLWSESRTILRALGVADASTKEGKEKAGVLIGRWLKDLGNDHTALLHVLRDAEATKPVGDPVAWIAGSVMARKRAVEGRPPKRTSDASSPPNKPKSRFRLAAEANGLRPISEENDR